VGTVSVVRDAEEANVVNPPAVCLSRVTLAVVALAEDAVVVNVRLLRASALEDVRVAEDAFVAVDRLRSGIASLAVAAADEALVKSRLARRRLAFAAVRLADEALVMTWAAPCLLSTALAAVKFPLEVVVASSRARLVVASEVVSPAALAVVVALRAMNRTRF
jgi:hypothetical protein